jgi:hypothetical protein
VLFDAGMIGHRQWAALGSAVLAAGVATGCGGAVPASGDPAPATSQALVAVALSHLTPQPYSIEYREPGAPIDDMGTTDPSLGGLLRWKPDPDWTLDVQVQPVPKQFPTCEQRGCVSLGGADLTWQDGGEDAPPALTVSVVRDDELRSVSYEGGMEGDPRTSLLPFDLMELEEIVTDPAFSLKSTTEAVEAGDNLAKDGVTGSRVKPRRLREPVAEPKASKALARRRRRSWSRGPGSSPGSTTEPEMPTAATPSGSGRSRSALRRTSISRCGRRRGPQRPGAPRA